MIEYCSTFGRTLGCHTPEVINVQLTHHIPKPLTEITAWTGMTIQLDQLAAPSIMNVTVCDPTCSERGHT